MTAGNDSGELVFVVLKECFKSAFFEFVSILSRNNDAPMFNPHGLDSQGVEAAVTASENGSDEYWLGLFNGNVACYGLLRGWDEGYSIPSLGVAVSPEYRRQGMARKMIYHLHARAEQRGARTVRLTVHKKNVGAVALYENIGYVFKAMSSTQLVGFCDIQSDPSAARSESLKSSVPVAVPDLTGREEEYVVDAVRSSWISSFGKYLDRFEQDFASKCGASAAVGVSNGTVALHLALLALDVRPGDEVLVPSLTYIATANAVRYVGAEPVFVDVDPDTWCIDPARLEQAVNRRTRGIIAVHLYGHPADMDSINEFAGVHGLWVVEDAAEAPFATYKGRLTGSLGRCATFSFYGNKVITSGEGGAVTSSDPQLVVRMRTLRGQGVDPSRRYHFPVIGYNFRMTNVAAALLCAQLERKDAILRMRRAVFQWYREALDGVEGIRFQPVAEWATVSPWLMCILVEKSSGASRDDLMKALRQEGIDSRPFFIPVHTLPPYREESLTRGDQLDCTMDLAFRGINLPTYPGLAKEDVVRISSIIRRVCS